MRRCPRCDGKMTKDKIPMFSGNASYTCLDCFYICKVDLKLPRGVSKAFAIASIFLIPV